MIIKRWNASTSQFVEEYPKTTIADVYKADGTTTFLNGGKIREEYLPNSVFDSLYFYGALSTNSDLSDLANLALAQGVTAGRSALGMYWVSNGKRTFTANSSAVNYSGTYITTGIQPSEEGSFESSTSVVLESGDWIVISGIDGSGTVGDPYYFRFAVINNTYDTATSTVPGIVEIGSDTVQTVSANAVTSTASRTYATQLNGNGQLVVNIPWTDTTYSQATTSTLGLIKLGDGTAQTVAPNTVTATASRSYALQVNASGQGVVNVPWTDTTYTAGGGLTLAGTTFSHTDTSSATNLTATSRTYVSGLTFDTYGHVTGYTTATETVVDTNTTYTAGAGLTLAGTEFSHSDTSSIANSSNTGGTVIQSLTFDTYGHAQSIGTIDLDGRYYTETEINTELGKRKELYVQLSAPTTTQDGAIWFDI